MRTFLIIDDNQSVRESLRFLLEHRGYATVLAESGPEGIALAEQQAFDGALIDVNMPGMNGLVACRELRARAGRSGRRLLVWMMTGAPTQDVVRGAEEAGAVALLPKPFEVAALIRELDEQFRRATPPAGSPADTPPDAGAKGGSLD